MSLSFTTLVIAYTLWLSIEIFVERIKHCTIGIIKTYLFSRPLYI